MTKPYQSTNDIFRRKNLHKAYERHVEHLLTYKHYVNTNELYHLLSKTYIKAKDGNFYRYNQPKKEFKRYIQKFRIGFMYNKINSFN